MKFVNATSYDLHFVINGVVFDVPAAGECEIEDGQEWVFESRGLPLKRVAEQATEPATPAAKASKPAASKDASAPKGKGAKGASMAPPAPEPSGEPAASKDASAPNSDAGSSKSKE